MHEQHPHGAEERDDGASAQDRETRLKFSGEVIVEHHSMPPKGPEDKRIHPRRPLPVVPDDRRKEDDEKGPGSSE